MATTFAGTVSLFVCPESLFISAGRRRLAYLGDSGHYKGVFPPHYWPSGFFFLDESFLTFFFYSVFLICIVFYFRLFYLFLFFLFCVGKIWSEGISTPRCLLLRPALRASNRDLSMFLLIYIIYYSIFLFSIAWFIMSSVNRIIQHCFF